MQLVLCNKKKVLLKVKRKFFKNVVRPAMIYRSECWILKQEKRNQKQKR